MSLFIASGDDAPLPPEAPPEEPPRRPATSAAMWQVHDSYIFAETRTGLIIMDQHSAHERVLYEETIAAYDRGGNDSQRLLFPMTLQLPPAQLALVEDLAPLFARTGFEVEPTGAGTLVVHAAPEPHAHFDAERCLRAMITELTEGSELVDAARSQHQRMALSFACNGSIRAGQRLSAREVGELFDRLFATELPYQDIHGRPTIVQLPLDELRSRFLR